MSCTDVQTIQAGNGTKTQFSFDFPYIFKSEIHVYFWNATTKEYDEKLTTDSTYPWRITDANPTIVEFTGTAPPAPATPVDPGETAVDNVKIRRITQIDDIRALFNPGSAIRSDDLNNNFEQLKYAIQEANCQGIPDDVDQYLKDYYWDRFDNTLYSADTWRSDDATIATTAALDQRFQDEVNETFTKAELAAASDVMPDNDDAVPTTGAVKDFVDHVVETDILVDGTGLNKTGSGGQVTLGISADSVDFDRIKDADKIQLADQNADYDLAGGDDKVFTASAAIRRFENYVQNTTPSGTGVGKGAVWVDVDDDLTLSVWNGSSWLGITSGGTFTNQPKVVYVDANSGDDSNDGHRISRPKKTIAAALNDINSDSVYGDGSIVSVAPGIYAETLPLDIQKNDVGIIGQSLRTCIIHPKIPEADQPTYDVDVPHSQELQTMFRVNSGSYFTNLTLTGLKASGTRGGSGSIYTDSTYGLPVNQGWNFGFYPNAIIKKSPYIQNVTNFSDSQINNVTFTPHTPGEGAAGDLDSAPTGGGILVDGSVLNTSSPLRSMVCDSYTHTALDGPGIFVTNNGYCQATSSYAFFNHAHIICINGGQANLAASTTDFGRFGLIADGKSSTAIFTSNVDGAASSGDTTFNINAPTAASGWFGSATRPQNNMLVTVNSVTYPVVSATSYTDSEGGAGWTVTISRPDPTDTATNLGLNGAVSDNAAVSFFLRSMVASSGHTMEYVGSGTDYTALPENGGVPVENQQVIERNDGKVWAATTDHKGTFKLGDFFTVDQQAGSLTVNSGSFQVDLGTLNVNIGGQAEVGADLDMGANELTSSTGDLKLQASGDINVQTNKIINVTDPTAAQDAATKVYVDNNTIGQVIDDGSPQLGGNLDVNGYEILSTGNGDVTINPAGTGKIVLDANVGVGTTSPSRQLQVENSSGNAVAAIVSGTSSSSFLLLGDTADDNIGQIGYSNTDNALFFDTNGFERFRIDSSGRLGLGTNAPVGKLTIGNSTNNFLLDLDSSASYTEIQSYNAPLHLNRQGNNTILNSGGGSVGIGTTSPSQILSVGATTGRIFTVNQGTANRTILNNDYGLELRSNGGYQLIHNANNSVGSISFRINSSEKARIDSSGNLLIGGTLPVSPNISLNANGSATFAGNVDVGNWPTVGSRRTNSGAILVNRADAGTSEVWSGRFSGTETSRINANGSATFDGNVAIGTTATSSNAKVEIKSTTGAINSATLKLNSSDTTTGAIDTGSTILLSGHDGSVTGRDFASIFGAKENSTSGNYASYLAFGTRANGGAVGERLRITSDGKVGVGTGSPNSILTTHPISGSFTTDSNDGNFSTYGLYIQETEDTHQNEVRGAIGFGTLSRKRAAIAFAAESDIDQVAISFYTNPTASGSSSTLNERMRIDSQGRVGIGTTSPNYKLTVIGDIITGAANGTAARLLLDQTGQRTYSIEIPASNDGLAVRDLVANTERARIDSSGRLLVGTATSSQYTVTNSSIQLTSNSSSNDPRLQLRANASTDQASIDLGGGSQRHAAISGIDGSLAFYTNSVLGNGNVLERARLDSSGRLLVGTSSTSAPNTLLIEGSNGGAFAQAIATLANTGSSLNDNAILGSIRFSDSSHDPAAIVEVRRDGGTWTSTSSQPTRLMFSTTADGASSPTERMRINSSGQTIMTANVASNYAAAVINDGNDVNRYGLKVQCGRDDSTGTNTAITFADGNNTTQGSITFSGGTVTYGTFTAYHPCILPDVDNESGYPYGTLLEITSIEYTQKDGQDTERGILYNVCKTQVANSRAVLGAYGSSMNGGPDGETNRHQALVLGDGHILCNNSGGNIKVGDGICSSAAPGIGQKATATPSMIIGIAQEDITFDSDEVKLVPVQYGLQQFIPWQD